MQNNLKKVRLTFHLSEKTEDLSLGHSSCRSERQLRTCKARVRIHSSFATKIRQSELQKVTVH